MKKLLPLFILILLAVLFSVPFWQASGKSFDIALSRYFYHPGVEDGWPEAKNLLWDVFYRGAPIIAILTGCIGVVGIVIGSLSTQWRVFRLWGCAIFLSLVLGPGLVINAVGKDHAARPRPRQIVELGGTLAYRPPLMFGKGDGKSFPCGHCSVGFVLGILALLLWPGRPRVATVVFILSFVFGIAMGIGRMAAGAHFFSDVLWSGLLTYSVVWLVYYAILRIPQRLANPEKFPPLGTTNRWVLGFGIGMAVCALGGITLLSMPYEQTISGSLTVSGIRSFVISAPSLNITVVGVEEGALADFISWEGSFKGFGFPGRKVEVRTDNITSGSPAIDFHKHGLFTDLEGPLVFKVNASRIHSIQMKLPASAFLTVRDETHGKQKLKVDREEN